MITHGMKRKHKKIWVCTNSLGQEKSLHFVYNFKLLLCVDEIYKCNVKHIYILYIFLTTKLKLRTSANGKKNKIYPHKCSVLCLLTSLLFLI